MELPNNAFSDAVLKSLLVERFPYFLAEVKKSLMDVSVMDALNEADEEGANDGESEDDDDMSNDGSSSPSAMDSEMPSGAGVDESDSEATGSPRHQRIMLTTLHRQNPLMPWQKWRRSHDFIGCYYASMVFALLLRC